MLHVQDLRKTYGATGVLEDVSFVLNDGERVGLIGPNGSGKSTLLRCLAGDEQPDGGRIVVTPAHARIGYLPQAFAERNQRSFSEVVDDAASQSPLRPAAVLAGLGLGNIDPDAPVQHLSGGQKTRLGLATLLLAEPDLLLLDEPTNHLDVEALEWRLVVQGCNLLLLDEPINHLDIESREHFEAALDAFEGSIVVVAHDRAF